MKAFTKVNAQAALATGLSALGKGLMNLSDFVNTATTWCSARPIAGTIAYYLYTLVIYVVCGWIMGDVVLAWLCWAGMVIYAAHLVATYKYGHWLAQITTDQMVPFVRKNVPLTMLGAIVCMLTDFTYTGIAIVAFGLMAYAHMYALDFTAKLREQLDALTK